jgi:hypothetical protein
VKRRERSAADLCAIYNYSTNPWIARTDHSHTRHALRARLARAQLRARFIQDHHYHEGESGRLYPGMWACESGRIDQQGVTYGR